MNKYMINGVNMNNNMETKELETYKCQICGKDSKDSIDAMTHYLHHGSTALAAVTAMIEEQRTGSVTAEDKTRITEENRVIAQNKGRT